MLNALLLASVLAVTLPPEPANHISDQAQLLNPAQTRDLEQMFGTVQNRYNVKLGVITLTELDDDPKIVSVRTLNYWNMSPDSVLLLISLQPRKIYLQPGSNLQYVFDERTSQDITRSMVPAMKSGRYGDAILSGVLAIANALPTPQVAPAPVAPQPQAAPRREPVRMDPMQVTPTSREIETVEETPSSGAGFLVFLLIVGVIGVIVYLGVRQHKANQRRATRRTGGFTPNRSSYDPDTGVRRSSGGGVTVVNNNDNDGLLTGLVVGSMLNQPSAPAPVAPPPAPPAPAKSGGGFLSGLGETLSDLSRSSGSSSRSSGRSSSGGGGGGSSWGSSSSSSSSYSDSGGGGSSWGSDSGGSSSSDSGGGGSDW